MILNKWVSDDVKVKSKQRIGGQLGDCASCSTEMIKGFYIAVEIWKRWMEKEKGHRIWRLNL